jgi:hypothetical protein
MVGDPTSAISEKVMENHHQDESVVIVDQPENRPTRAPSPPGEENSDASQARHRAI